MSVEQQIELLRIENNALENKISTSKEKHQNLSKKNAELLRENKKLLQINTNLQRKNIVLRNALNITSIMCDGLQIAINKL